jgi:hypothetical protein
MTDGLKAEEPKKKTHADWIAEGYKPGQAMPGGAWLSWAYEDLDPNDTVTFLCQDVLGTQGGNFYYGKDEKAFKLDINSLECWFKVGKINTVNRFFYNRYEQMVNDNIQLEEFKRGGPKAFQPWSTWAFQPFAMTFGMDIDGKYLKDPKWYEYDADGIPIKISNIKAFAEMYFSGMIDIKLTKLQFAQLVWLIFTTKVKGKLKKILRRK